MGSDPESLVFSKSLALVQKTKKRVVQVDGGEFPTPSSEQARTLLLAALTALGNPAFWPPMNPEALYSSLIQIQTLVEEIEASNNAHIAWPLVSCCDHIWKQFFPSGEAQIFYSVMTEHNYGIGSFSFRLKRLIEKVLPPSEVEKILKGQNLYCLQLASLEDENLPLYANIGHEFGHALYRSRKEAILKLLASECDGVYKLIVSELTRLDPALVQKRKTKTALIIRGIATELFCDLIGFLISGPAFLLSLHEMAWGVDQGTWRAGLTPTAASIHAYPSYHFRFHCLRKRERTASFEAEANRVFKALEKGDLCEMSSYLSTITADHSADRVEVSAFSDPDNDRLAVESAITKHLGQLKVALEGFVARCWNEFLTSNMKDKEFPPVSTEDVFQLLRRLEKDILPNIIPNNTLLGVPASFSAILNASAIYRVHVLSTSDNTSGPDEIYRDIQKVERLTAKALEVSYIQGEFKRWEADH
ncbi:MAG TPA: hypothetical protein VN578_09615 [Candidatus Binatia bacterium]|jgi:hypothetical protein|nr:hypothetical protein [Candidatus Binatia bacterium]